jgi:lipid-binding SYLF domain-containing protein
MVSRGGVACFCLAWLAVAAARAPGQSADESVVEAATDVLRETMLLPAEQIPRHLLAEARGIAVFPSMLKGGLVLGVRHGRGIISVRDRYEKWQPPVFLSITGGSVGWQVGLQATDLILVFRTRKSIGDLLQNKVTLGVDAAVSAGPVGRMAAASTDLMLRAEILSYSRSRGLFAGVSLDGSSLQVDPAKGQLYYAGSGTNSLGISVSPTSTIPASAQKFLVELASHTASVPTAGATAGETPVSVTAPAAEPPGGSESRRAAAPDPDTVRKQLVEASAQLGGLLDDPWKRYLQLPSEITGPAPAAVPDMNRILRRYATVAADPRFASLAKRPEFVKSHHLLRAYADMVSDQDRSRLTLPPPPPDPPQTP